MIEAAYLNPSAYGDLTGLNKWVWILSHISGDQKFMTIFSILFGAGIILMSRKAESKGRRPHGLDELSFSDSCIHHDILWSWLGIIRQGRKDRTDLYGRGLVDRSVDPLPYLAAPFQIRPCRMALALSDLWQSTTHANFALRQY